MYRAPGTLGVLEQLPIDPLVAALIEALELPAELFPVSAPPRPELGDFAVGTFPAAKQRKAPPPKLAAEVAARFQPTDLLAEATAAGPYVNFKARRPALFAHLFSATVGGGSLVPDVGGGRAVDLRQPALRVDAGLEVAPRRRLQQQPGRRIVAQVLLGDPARVNTDLARLQAVTAADVQRVMKKYFTDANRFVLYYLPEASKPKKEGQ